MENFLLIFVSIFAGYLIQKANIFSKDAATTLNQFVIYISFPAIILLQVPKISFSMEMLYPAFIAWIVMFFSALAVLFISKMMHFSKEITGALMLVGVLTNSSFLGIPIVNAYLGADAIAYVLVYDQLGTFLAFTIYGTFVASYYSSEHKLDFKLITRKLLTFPPFMALLLAFFLIGREFHPAITSTLSSLSATIVPLALVAVGLQLQFRLPKDDFKPFGAALFVKLIFAPLVAIIICEIFDFHGLFAQVSILEAGMAPMITAGVLASMAGLAPRLSSSIVGYGILVSFVTTGFLYLLF
ncbi:MAG: AEC family transporter [Sulfurimonas sp.]|nr:AEC family transporter [Sulfurimonas sp.]MBU3940262.1 AEC family transporter [bacterium]MBU4024309.1 AEC family transporter [bacterium]MBU4058110.1 AEC family transporter [bacterium]MBU4110813.1 AEC family transporter [bacterium]